MMETTPDQIVEKLREVIDPEVGLNIVDMGLVYEVAFEKGIVDIRMTLTTQGCPMGPYIEQEVHKSAGSLEGVNEVRVHLVWEPPWSPDQIIPEALEFLRTGRPY